MKHAQSADNVSIGMMRGAYRNQSWDNIAEVWDISLPLYRVLVDVVASTFPAFKQDYNTRSPGCRE
jgi:hypothetical protein